MKPADWRAGHCAFRCLLSAWAIGLAQPIPSSCLASDFSDELQRLERLWCDRTDDITGPMTSPLVGQALVFEMSVRKRLAEMQRSAEKYAVTVQAPEFKVPPNWKMRQAAYRRGSLPPQERKAYEAAILNVVQSANHSLQDAIVWKREQLLWNPRGAATESAKAAVADAEQRAQFAESQAEERGRDLRRAEERARLAEESARQKEVDARRDRERALVNDERK